MRILLACGLTFAGSCASNPGRGPSPFTSDGCSASPDGPPSDPDRWSDDCLRHDYRYWRGGRMSERLAADRELAAGMNGSGNPLMAGIYFVGVRFGGSPWWPTPWRWGYGWDYPFGYRDLTAKEIAALDRVSPGPPIPLDED